MKDSHLSLITGGSRSGKSSYALNLAQERAGDGGRAFFLATAQPIDDEMRARIAHHRSLRPGIFETIEEPVELCEVLAKLDGRCEVLVIDCLTIWISNLLAANRGHDAIMAEADRLAIALRAAPFSTFVVTDEVGSGIVPMEPLSRSFRDLLGWTNQALGRAADRIVLMVAGYPLRVK
ncbi:MAG TPA: bifunctional adenosylcobinamide kinase/adenosylcobinamide-phosphate guanylyltransferase [Candidatus Binataceae bacterium]|nr:bifunctional adenosylcobinamide kinase/adenosylcobinamide-phosphate guanylyltransferase [Candidatus Binataceae bacterium]